MELLYKAAAAALVASVIGLLLRKRNPELALLLGAATAAGILLAATGMLSGLRELQGAVKALCGSNEVLLAPVFKCLAISVITRFSMELCRDSAQNAAAAAVELCGTVCAMSTVMPLLISILKLVGGML